MAAEQTGSDLDSDGGPASAVSPAPTRHLSQTEDMESRVGVSLRDSPLKPLLPAPLQSWTLPTHGLLCRAAQEEKIWMPGALEALKEDGGPAQGGAQTQKGVQGAWGLVKWLTSPFWPASPGKISWTIFRSRNGREEGAENSPIGPGPAQRILGAQARP